MDMDMHHGHGFAEWTWFCSMDMVVQHGYEHAAWTWTCSMYISWHAIWAWPCSMDLEMLHVHVHAAWTWTSTITCCLSMFMSMLHVHGSCPCFMSIFMSMLHVQVHAACPRPCCMFTSMLHVSVHAACPCPCCMPMSICCLYMSMVIYVFVAVSMSTLRIDTWYKYSMNIDMLSGHGHAEWDMQHAPGHVACTWSCSMHLVMQHGHGAVWAWTWTHSTDLEMQHGLGYGQVDAACLS
jgi:hypothetical protein